MFLISIYRERKLSICIISFHLKDGGAEFVFATDSQKKRGWGERMFSSIGTSYMTGKMPYYSNFSSVCSVYIPCFSI